MTSPMSGQENVRIRAHRLAEEIRAHFTGAIATHEMVVGHRLPSEREIGTAFGASRSVVRAALDGLERAGLVERKPGSGTYVCEAAQPAVPEAAETETFQPPLIGPIDVLEARRIVEPHYVDLVVTRATEDDFERMLNRLRALEAAVDQVQFKKAAYLFHIEIARATRNPLIIFIQEMIMAARARAGWSTLLMLHDSDTAREKHLEEFRAIYDALRARDRNRAAKAMEEMLSEMVRTILAAPLTA